MDALPPDVRLQLVMTASVLDGQAVTTHRFRSAEPPASLLASVGERWRAEGRAVVESRTGPWRLLSARDGAGFTTLQVRAAERGTEGLVSQWGASAGASDGAAAPPDPPPARWLPAQARVVRRIVHRDPGRDAATLVAWVPATPDEASRALRGGASREGFVDDPAVGAPASGAAWYRGHGEAGTALAFRRGREEVVATVSGHRDGSAVVLHWGAAR
jgi:hypothetical protein